ncbi:MAG: hypothetical protein IKX47_06485, partial [Oscillospiraceae bacterium]|nr:hypothetical protein [Oscillospiraceae bacterium]
APTMPEEEEEGQNPVMNWIGEYRCPQAERASAHVECGEGSSAIIRITWGSSAWEQTQWLIVGELDPDTLTITYTGASRTNVTYNDDGTIAEEVTEYADGTGTIVFDQGTSFTWHEDQGEREDLVFEWAPTMPEEEEEGQNPVMNWIGRYSSPQEERASAVVACEGMDSARITITWSGSAWERAEWEIIGKLDLDTLTITYTGATKAIVTRDENGNVVNEEVEYSDGTGTIVFDEGTSFTWHEDQGEREVLFRWILGG